MSEMKDMNPMKRTKRITSEYIFQTGHTAIARLHESKKTTVLNRWLTVMILTRCLQWCHLQ